MNADLCTLRDRAIDAAKQAINAGGYWLPPAGQEAAVDAVLSVVTPEAAARLGTPAGQSALDRILADAAHHDECANLSQTPEGAIAHSSMAAGLRIAAEHVRLSRDAELEASQRRAVRIQELLDDTRDRMRKLAAALANGDPWNGNEPHIGEQIIAALYQPKGAEPVSRYDDMSEQARFYLSNHDEIELAEMLASSNAMTAQLKAELAAFHEGEEPHLDEHTVTTPAQWIWRWNRATPEQRLEVAARVSADGDRAHRCLLGDHEGQHQRLRDAWEAIARVRAALDAVEADSLAPRAVLQRIRAALEPPKETP